MAAGGNPGDPLCSPPTSRLHCKHPQLAAGHAPSRFCLQTSGNGIRGSRVRVCCAPNACHTAPPVCCGTDPEIPEIPICTKGTLKPAPGALFLPTGAVQAWINARAVETSKLLTPSLLPRQRDQGWSGSLRPFLRLPSFSASPASQPAAKGACFPGRCHNAATHRAASERQCQTRCPEYKNK